MKTALLSATILLLALPIAAAQDDPYRVIKRNDAKLAKQDPAAVARKYAVMSSNPFSYYRGSDDVFQADMAKGWLLSELTSKKTDVWLANDMHLMNAGVVPTGDGSLAFQINDFDAAKRGPYIEDLQRLVVSTLLAAEEAGISRKKALAIVEAMATEYLSTLKDVKKGDLGADWRWTEENARGPIKKALAAGAKKNHEKQIADLTEERGGALRFKIGGEVTAVTAKERQAIDAALDDYIRSIPKDERKPRDFYEILDVARKNDSGTGSLGLERFWVLIRGASDDPKDARVLEWKEGRGDARDVVAAYRALQQDPERFLGDATVAGRSFLVREHSPHKVGVDPAKLDAEDLEKYSVDVARTLAHAHAFSGGEKNAVAKATAIRDAAGGKDNFTSKVVAFADRYADEALRQFDLFREGVARDAANDKDGAKEKDARKDLTRDRGFERGPSRTRGIVDLVERETSEEKGEDGR